MDMREPILSANREPAKVDDCSRNSENLISLGEVARIQMGRVGWSCERFL